MSKFSWTKPFNFFPVISTLLAIRDAIYLVWNWIVSHYSNLRIVFLISLTVASVRAAVGIFGVIFTHLQNICGLGTSTANAFAGLAGSPQAGFFDKVNAIFPLAETFAFLSAYGAVLTVTTVYMLVRAAYKNVPMKAT